MNLLFWYRSLMRSVGAMLVKLIATATSGLVSFTTNVIRPVKVTCEFSPVQDLHGISNPYLAGGSVNLIPDGTDTENGYISGHYLNADGTTTANAQWYVSEYFTVDPSITYTWSSRSSDTNSPCICFYDENKEFISAVQAEKLLPKTITPPSGAVYCRSSQDSRIVSGNTYGLQLEVGSVATSVVPYSNVCPISGWTDMFIAHVDSAIFVSKNGSNLVQGYITDYNGKNTAGTSIVRENDYIPVEPNTTYYIISDIGRIRAFEYSGNHPDYFISAVPWTNGPILTLTTQSNTHFIRFQCGKYPTATTVPEDVGYIGIYKERFPVNWETEAGTVYGGTVTLNEDGSADLTPGYQSYTRNLSIASSATVQNASNSVRIVTSNLVNTPNSGCLSDKMVNHATSSNIKVPVGVIYFGAGWIRVNHKTIGLDYSTATLAEIRTAANNFLRKNNPFQIVAPVSGQTPIHFDNIGQLNSFLGTNNIWHNMNGDITVEYWKKQ